eukprot:TRINITY_DN22306_c0_g1_i1.p1 TRINITY_DN22306_c0_g1~~TRINITY_DN22306_c0_g1_i1.p1  ORF type:complete len:325 (+),score=28.27 TRINITY_DN22306_c0_g1_i1:159-1133(+)
MSQSASLSSSLSSSCVEKLTWVSNFSTRSLVDLREFLWDYVPGAVATAEREDKRCFTYPQHLNLLTLGPARSGKSSYVNSIMTIFNPDSEVMQTHSELGTDTTTGTIYLEGPYCVNKTKFRLWTTMGVNSFSDNQEVQKQFEDFVKRCFLGYVKPGDYSGHVGSFSKPLLKRKFTDPAPHYDLAILTAKYGCSEDAELVTKFFVMLSKENKIPCIVLVTHSGEHTQWDELGAIDPTSVFYIENYAPNEPIQDEKSKKLIVPLLEGIKKMERSDIFWSYPHESTLDNMIEIGKESLRFGRELYGEFHYVVWLVCLVAVVVGFFWC